MVLVVKNLPANEGDIREAGSVPGLGRSPGEGHSNPLQYFLPGESHGQRSQVGYGPRSCKALDMTKKLSSVSIVIMLYVSSLALVYTISLYLFITFS